MRGKRILPVLLALTLAIGMVPPARAAFSDTAGHWAEEAVNKWSGEYNIITGYEDGTFRPDESITRGAFAGILDRFLKFQSKSPVNTFSDVEGTYWEDAILKLHAAGVYLGNQGKALSGQSITRQQAVAMIARAFAVTGEETALAYSDAADVAAYARAPLAEMTAQGWINDSGNGFFRPTEAITRAEIVNILNNMIQVLVQSPTTYTGTVDGTLMINSAEGAHLKDTAISGDLILAPGVSSAVTLENVTIQGALRNFSSITPDVITIQEPSPPVPVDPDPTEPSNPTNPTNPTDPVNPDPQNPVTPTQISPSEIYTPSATTGEYFTYSGDRIPVRAGLERSRLKQGDFVWSSTKKGRLEYVGTEFQTRFGIDVSSYQNRDSKNNTIDWNAVRNDGVEFAMVRVGLRGYSTGKLAEDPFYRQNLTAAMAAGIDTGAYIFAQAISVEEAIEEAEFVLKLLDGYPISGPVAYDWEINNKNYRGYNVSPEMATACAVAFCQRIEQAGYRAMVYAGNYVAYQKYDLGVLAPYMSWYPQYRSATSENLYPSYYYQMDYWQFSDSCPIAGIGDGVTTKVDADLQFIPYT